MLKVLIIFAVGLGLGYLLRKKDRLLPPVETITQIAITVMLFLLGVNVGKNEKIIANLSTIGFQSLILTIGAMAGSIIAAWFLFHYFFRKK